MFKFVKNIFSSKNENEAIKPVSPDSSNEYQGIEELFLNELKICPYINEFSHEAAINHFTHKFNLHKTENLLTKEEKQELGFNTRLSLTKEFVSILSEAGLAHENPKNILTEIYNKVTITKAQQDNFNKAVKAGIKTFTLEATGGGSPCDWCKSNAGKEFSSEILAIIEKNCTCKPYSWSYINPVVKI